MSIYILPLSHCIALLNFSTYTYSIFRIRGRNLFTQGNDVMGNREVFWDRDQVLLGTGSSGSAICQARGVTWLRLREPREGGLWVTCLSTPESVVWHMVCS